MTTQQDAPPESLFGPGPAREAHVSVRDRWSQCTNLPDGHPHKVVEFVHRQLNEELNVLENTARCLVDFPDADWDLRMCLARQAADEARHAQVYSRLLRRRGVAFGDFPVMNFQYRILERIPTLIGRLAVQNRTFEADGLDAAVFGVREARSLGELELADLFDALSADETMHVWFANEWIRKLVARAPRSLLDVASALTHGARAFEWVFAGGGTQGIKYAVSEEARRLAGFEPGEIEVSATRSRARRQERSRPSVE